MSEQIRISAKNLGALALSSFCPRCFWIKLRLNNKLPFQIFPGIFSSIDAYSKRVIHSWFDEKGEAPPWLSALGSITAYKKPPHYSSFFIIDRDTNIKLTGSPDGVLVKADNSHVIVDYKTAKFTPAQDELLPMYEVQLNAYGLIGEQTDLSPVTGLALIYTEPMTDDTEASNEANRRDVGFAMGFSASIHPVEVNAMIIKPLLKKTRELYEQKESPAGVDGCKDCDLLDDLVEIASQ